MDGSYFPPEKTMPQFSEYGSAYDDPALTRQHTFFLRIDCECGCRGQNHDELARTLLRDRLRKTTSSPSTASSTET